MKISAVFTKWCSISACQLFLLPLTTLSIHTSFFGSFSKAGFCYLKETRVCTNSQSYRTTNSNTNIKLKMADKFRHHSDLSWDLTIPQIEKNTDRIISETKSVYDFVGSLKSDNLTYNNIIKKLADDACTSSSKLNNINFVQHVFDDKDLREASVTAAKKISEFAVEISMRQDVFDNLVAFEKLKPDMNPEANRFLERLIKVGRRNGLHLPKEKQDKIKEFKKRQSDLCIDFSKNLNDENTTLEYSEAELAGLPEDFIKNLNKSDSGKLKVTLKYPHYFPVMKKAQIPETRRRMYNAFTSRCLKENTAILEELVELRHKQAQILGFPSHSAYILDMRMAKTTVTVDTFLKDLFQKLKPLRDAEVATYLKYKKQECKELGLVDNGQIHMYDLRYYMNMVEEKDYVVDHELLRQYFPMNVVIKGLLDIYQELLGLTFTEVPDAKTWNKDVQLFSVADSSSKEHLGYFFLDLYPREGKFGHAAVFPMQPGCTNPEGKRQSAVVAMVANFPKATDDHPSLLAHDDVETFFHEFGHVMHGICSKAQFEEFVGTSVERDFVEAPSQMLENWVWEEGPIRRMSAHHEDGRPIPDALLTALINSRTANAGVINIRQILFSELDQCIHTQAKADTGATFAKLTLELMGMNVSEGTNMAASFGHLAGGYDAQYYGYLWSEVYSADMFASRFKKQGIMNPTVGQLYRKCILEIGGTKDAADMLRSFLDREPQQDAFLASKGLKV